MDIDSKRFLSADLRRGDSDINKMALQWILDDQNM
jgi:hypothetical protein